MPRPVSARLRPVDGSLRADVASRQDIEDLRARVGLLGALELRSVGHDLDLSDLGTLGVAAPRLAVLDIARFIIPRDCRGCLAAFANLEELCLDWTAHDDKAFPALPPSLKHLALLGTESNVIELQLEQCPRLEELRLFDLVVYFGRLPQTLRSLALKSCNIEERALATVPTANLRSLRLEDCTLGDDEEELDEQHVPPLPGVTVYVG